MQLLRKETRGRFQRRVSSFSLALAVGGLASYFMAGPPSAERTGTAGHGFIATAGAAEAEKAATPTFDLQRAKAIKQKVDAGETVSAEDRAYLDWAHKEFEKRGSGKQEKGKKKLPVSTTPVSDPKMVASLVPLDELTGQYKGEDGGLYGGGRNAPPAVHMAAYEKESAQIQPLDADGKPSPKGKIVVLSIGMSNTTMEYSHFVTAANADPDKSPSVVVVDGAKGGRTGAAWSLDGLDLLPAGEAERLAKMMDAAGRSGNRGSGDTWSGVVERLKTNGVTTQQIQVLWIKEAEITPAKFGEFPNHARTLQANVVDILNIAKQKYPNLRVAYLSSRIFAGYATTELNPEPYAYEGAFAMRWVIQDQIKGEPRLNYDPARGAVKSPIVMWGPYLWANGKTPRKSDGLIWAEEDLITTDHTHPSDSGRDKVAGLLLKFFKTDPTAKRWFTTAGASGAGR